ncbi:MAG: response regulator [Spirochaetaceae bacterium]|jgi:PAS domain S-box-containing protein|nr:response regulator [Spirochaetaceae bacterium]
MDKNQGRVLLFCMGILAGLLAGFSLFFIVAGHGDFNIADIADIASDVNDVNDVGTARGIPPLIIIGVVGVCILLLVMLSIGTGFLFRGRHMSFLELLARKIDNTFVIFNMKKRRFDYISPRFSELYDIPTQALYADPRRIIIPSNNKNKPDFPGKDPFRDMLNGRYDDVLAAEGSVSEYRISLVKDEKLVKRWIRVLFFPVEYPLFLFSRRKPNALVIVFADVTAEKKEEHNKFRKAALIDASNRMVFIMYLDGRISYTNRAFAETCGYSEAYLRKRSFFELCTEGAEDRFFSSDRFQKACSKEGIRVISAIRCANGNMLPVELHFSPVRNNAGELIEISCFVENITERLEHENMLKAAVIEAQSANRAKSDFLARMSHEIRTPMNTITSMSQLGLHPDKVEKRKIYFERINTAGKHLLALVNDVLDMSKIESGKFTLVNEPFRLDTLIGAVRDIITPKADEKGIVFTVEQDTQKPLFLEGDAMRLQQCLLNFLSNAVKFTPAEGQVTLSIKTEDRGGERVQITFSVRDTGIGMTEEFQRNLFQPFNQGDTSISRRFGGTGLGLAISRSLIELMGGTVAVSSRENEGSVFSFTLTLKYSTEELSSEKADDGGRASCKLNGMKVLLVDDVSINQDIIIEMLENTGAEIVTASDGLAAVKRFSDSEVGFFSVVFMDVQMPDIDGYEATRRIRALPRDDAKTIPVYAMTAHAFNDDVAASENAGMNGHISKPIDIKRLFRILRDIQEMRK